MAKMRVLIVDDEEDIRELVELYLGRDGYDILTCETGEQALVNLIDNAIKYSDSGQSVQIAVQQDEGEVKIAVSDQGCGIPDKHHARLFERFYVVDKGRSRKLGGTGLGLAIVKHIANVHGGTINLKSEMGAGSTFTLCLPRQDAMS
jgi:two-component system phosphate regulon sensor histidine kinase PhoR